MYSSNTPNRSQSYHWTGSPGRVSGPSTHDTIQPASTYAHWPISATYPSTNSTAGNLTLGSFTPATLYAGTYPDDASHPLANTYQASGQASSVPYTYGSQIDLSNPFSGGSGYQGYNPTTAPSTSPRGDRATRDTAPGHSATYGESLGNNVIHLSPYQPSTFQQAESSKPSHKRKSRKDATMAAHKASQPAPAPAAAPGDDSDEEHAKKKSKTDAEKLHKKAMQQKSYRAKYAGVLKDMEDALPETYKTHNVPLTRVKYIKDTPAIHERNVELSRELNSVHPSFTSLRKSYGSRVMNSSPPGSL
ncbi:hypothetical protein EVG20_g5763 [Dentipellis fragilis]|uniref:Uncharacterized protein n=1 Tax=Dentipellis fragilis TaxID=205917 RepID=A0A4Y9YRC2_9AGAM|nr:hypothetical protein EVG20_g5763 [Dentipellis fragilis]